MITRRIKLDEINDAFAAMERGEVIRQVISFPAHEVRAADDSGVLSAPFIIEYRTTGPGDRAFLTGPARAGAAGDQRHRRQCSSHPPSTTC